MCGRDERTGTLSGRSAAGHSPGVLPPPGSFCTSWAPTALLSRRGGLSRGLRGAEAAGQAAPSLAVGFGAGRPWPRRGGRLRTHRHGKGERTKRGSQSRVEGLRL